jgi:hypothetical protein
MRGQIPLTYLLCLGLAAPLSSACAGPQKSTRPVSAAGQPRVADVALTDTLSLRGVVISEAGQPLAGTRVALCRQGEVLQQTDTADNGLYEFPNLQTGVYELVVGPSARQVRVWSAANAPPGTASSLALVMPARVVRGQWGGPGPGAVADILILGVGAAGLAIGLSALDKANDLEDQINAPASP